MMRQYELVEKVAAYDPRTDEAMPNRAYVLPMKAHGAQRRASGDPYFSHPLEVAGMGGAIDIPIGHIDAAYVRSHFDAMEVSVPDAPRANEDVGVTMGPDPHAFDSVFDINEGVKPVA